MSRVRAAIGIGSNLDDPVRIVRGAIEALRHLPDSAWIAASSLYRTEPIGLKNQPDFINAVALVDTELGAHALLDQLFAIERRFGRRRDYRHSPRTLDLDLLIYGSLQHRDPRLTVPHPAMHERAFVLVPLLEVDREAIVPGIGRADALLGRCANQRIERIDD